MYIPKPVRTYLRDRFFCYSFFDQLKYVLSAFIPIEFSIRIRQLKGKAMLVRGCTADRTVLRTTFFNQYDSDEYRFLPFHAVCLDLGANVGYTIVQLKQVRPDVTITGVELDPQNVMQAVKNTGQFVKWGGVWHEPGTLTYSGKDEQSFSIGGGAHTAPAVTVGDLVKGHIDYIKMDIEGAESKVLTESNEWLDRVDTIRVEVHNNDTDVLQKVLEGSGFRVTKDTKHWSTLIATKRPPLAPIPVYDV